MLAFFNVKGGVSIRSRRPNVRVNSSIRASEVRLIGQDGKLVGIKPIHEAMRLSEDQGLDLIEIVPTARPPVCKIGSLSKYLYEKEKKSKEARKHRSGGQVKEVRFRMKIGEHDFNTKVNKIVEFLKNRHKVRVSLMFFGREMQHKNLGDQMIQRIEQQISSVGVIEQRPQFYGNRMISILVPNKG